MGMLHKEQSLSQRKGEIRNLEAILIAGIVLIAIVWFAFFAGARETDDGSFRGAHKQIQKAAPEPGSM
jgi:hypothetical protein